MNMYVKANVLFKFGSLERLYVEMRLPYNQEKLANNKFGGLVTNVQFRNISGF